jgi:hypothetical protein
MKNPVHLVPQRVAQPDQVGALILEHDHRDGRLAVDAEQDFLTTRAQLDIGHVSQQHGAIGRDSRVFERGDPARPSVEDHHGAPVLVLDPAEVALAARGPRQGGGDLLGQDAHRGAAVGIDAHGHLARGSAARHNPRHAGNRE